MSKLDSNDRFIISRDDKAGLVVIVTAIGLSWTFLTLIIRIVSKLHIKRSIGLEEALVIAASTFAFITSCCILVAVKYGFGRKGVLSSSSTEEIILKLLWTSDIFYIVTLGVAKSATIPLLMQLTPMKRFVKASWAIAGLICSWCFVSSFLVAFRCHAGSPWDDATTSQCSSVFSRWAFIESLSIIIEICIFGLFLAIVYILRMRVKAKVKVMLAFSTRLTVIIPTIFRLLCLESDLRKAEPTFSLLYSVIAAQVVLHYTTMAASFAYLKPFLGAFDSNLGATVKVDTIVSSGYPVNSRSNEHSSRDRQKPKRGSTSFATAAKARTSERDIDTQHVLAARSRRTIFGESLEALDHVFESDSGNHRYLINQKRMSHLKRESEDSITPIITKTQEWQIHIEPRDASLHAM